MKQNGLVIQSVVVGSVGTNCYIVYREGNTKCVVVDPGDSGKEIGRYIREHGLSLEDILLPVHDIAIRSNTPHHN